MRHLACVLTLGLLILVQACTGQKPVELKNSSTPRNFVKASCSSMIFEGQILSKKNILNILDCSGWAKQFPDLHIALKEADEKSIDQVFKPINDQFFLTSISRKNLFELVAQAQARGELATLAKILQKGLAEHKLLSQVNLALQSENVSLTERSDFFKVLSASNHENLKLVKALKNVLLSYEQNKPIIDNLFSEEDKLKLAPKVVSLLTDFSKNMDSQSWSHLAKVLYDGDSPIQTWAQDGLEGDVRVLLSVIESPTFFKDSSFLKNSLTTGISCVNRASQREFQINIAQELKHKIEGLKTDDKETFEKLLLHGLSKFLAFQEFCEEKNAKQGINSFYMVLKHAFKVLPSSHDFNFLKRIHQIFGEDRYVFLSFLSSDSFASLRNLLRDLKSGERDEELVHSLYRVLSELSDDDLMAVSQLVKDLSHDGSQSQSWHKSWSGIWNGLSQVEKEQFVQLSSLLIHEDVQGSDALNLIEMLMVSFPDFSPAIANSLGNPSYQESLRYLTRTLSEENVQKDLSSFLSEKGLFELIEILTKEYAPTKPVQVAQRQERKPVTYVQTIQSTESERTRGCFDLLTKSYEANPSYYNIVNTLPEVCLSILGQAGYVGQIYLWMNSSQNYFIEKYQIDDFHSQAGVWAPGMLQFIFSSAVKADFIVKSSNGSVGILANVDEIHKNLTDPKIMESFHQLSLLYGTVNNKIGLDNRLQAFFNEKQDEDLNNLMRDTFVLLEKKDPGIHYNVQATSCKDLSANLGANPCLTEQEVVSGVTDIVRILKRKNEKGSSLVKELVGWVHPGGGVKIPFKKIKLHNYKTSFDEIIHFLYDLSDEKTSKEFYIYDENSSRKVKGTIIDRLEVVIRDIGFTNNFYGAFFKNQIAGAFDYRSKVISSEVLLELLEGSGGLFRGVGGMPKESRHKLKNIRGTYSSMVELSDKFEQPDGSTRSYGLFIQSLLAAIAESSKISTQKINPVRFPNEKVTEGHNGVFLTRTVQLSGLRHLSQFVRARFDHNLSALNSDTFLQINNHLIGRHDLEQLQVEVQNLLDKYLDNDRNQLNLMLKDSISFLSSLKDPEDQKALEEIALKGIILLSKKEISTQNIKKLASTVELTIKMWPEISEILSKVEDKKKLLKLINEMLNGLLNNPRELDRLITTLLKSALINHSEIETLLEDEKFRVEAAALLNQLASLQGFESDLNWLETVKAVFSSDMQWESLRSWFETALGEKPNKLTLSLLLQVMGEKDQGNYRLKQLLDELFINHRSQLEQFMNETFKSLELKPD